MAVLALLDRMLNPNIGMVHRVAILVEWVFQCVDAPTQHDMVVLSSSHQRHDGQDRFDAPRIEPLNLSLTSPHLPWLTSPFLWYMNRFCASA